MTDLLTDTIKLNYLIFFLNEVRHDRISNIRKLYEAAHITNDMLVSQLHQHTDNMADLDHCVFNDIATILAGELVRKEELTSCFDTLYTGQYRKVYTEHEKIRTVLVEEPERGKRMAREMIRWIGEKYVQGKIEEKVTWDWFTGDRYLAMLLILRDPVYMDNEVLQRQTILSGASEWNKWVTGTSGRSLNDQELVFTEEKEPIYSSGMYAKFVRKTKEGIAAFLGTDEKQLASYLRNQIDQNSESNGKYDWPEKNEGGVASTAALQVIQNHHGNAQWFQSISAPRGRLKGSTGYRPDVDQLLDAYCRARVEVAYDKCADTTQSFTKADLMRECRAETPRDDYLAILYLYNMDILYQMFQHMMEMYYRNFSWDAISGQTPQNRANQYLREMESSIAKKDRTIADLRRRLDAMRAAENKSVDAGRIAMQKENERLLDTIDEKDREIAELKEKIRLQDELIEASEREDEAPEDITVDLGRLQKKRYLFVGHTEENYPELDHTLRKYFPDSIYMESKSDAIDQVQVDAVVFLIKWLSHAMYYKARSAAALKDVPVIFCNTRNIGRILQEMQEGLSE